MFVFFTCYCQHKYIHKDEKDKLLELVEEEYDENDKNNLLDPEMGSIINDESFYYRNFASRENDNPLHGIGTDRG